QTGAGVADEALTLIQLHASRYGAEEFFPLVADRAALMKFLKPRAGLYACLSQMHDCGLLGRMFPEFQAISCRVVRDFYHKYTVDEHTLLTIRNLERLAVPAALPHERFASLLGDLTSPELLVLALLFHAVGKWRDEARSAAVAAVRGHLQPFDARVRRRSHRARPGRRAGRARRPAAHPFRGGDSAFPRRAAAAIPAAVLARRHLSARPVVARHHLG